MVSDPVSFNGNTRVEVITVLANCGRDTDRARQALVTWIQRKQAKGRTTEHILAKLRDIELKFLKDTSLHSAFRDARAETYLPKPPDLPPPRRRRTSTDRRTSITPTISTITTDVTDSIGPSSASSSPRDIPPTIYQPMSPSTSSPSPPHPTQIPEISPQQCDASRVPGYLQQRASFAPPPPSPRIQIPRARSLQPAPHSPLTSSPESEPRPRYRYMSQPVGSTEPLLRRVTPPRTSAPTAPLPPIPSAPDLEPDIEGYSASPIIEQPLTPPPSIVKPPPSPGRPLPMQPVPSPVPDPDESEFVVSTSRASLRRYWEATHGEIFPSDEVVRDDSPVYILDDDSISGASPIPCYVDQYGTYTPLDGLAIDDRLDRALKVCGDSPEVRTEVTKCLKFFPGYEPPYWQSHLRACNLNAEAARYLLDEMCRQVDWSALGRAI